MKNDIQLKGDVEDELQWDPAVDADRFAIRVKNGVVTISGSADSFADKHAAEEAICRVAGVTALVARPLALVFRRGPSPCRPSRLSRPGSGHGLMTPPTTRPGWFPDVLRSAT